MNFIDAFLHKVASIPIFFPPDVYERHRFVANRIYSDDTVLDVGGELGQLKKFSSAEKIIVANLHEGDIPFDGKHLPLDDESFSVVTAIDVLEHIQKSERKAFIQELWRVTKDRLFISFPLGTPEHVQAEKDELKKLQNVGQSVEYLEEHVQCGLPAEKDIDEWLGISPRKHFVGDFRLSRRLFYLHNAEVQGLFGKLFFFCKLLLYFKVNLLFYPLLIRIPRHEETNRMYCEWRKE